ncbi:class F sortase [Streptomyces sp. GESEQ-35]|uniref:class F sortase n=1 Tax=Streptomyces sp. GESEQ-35 TaxID=2812657 RepID=UPI001B31F711|nr:class F sortase [Streptomyces sp. GESEQ-35]
MTPPLSRRAFATAAGALTASLVAGCGGGTAGTDRTDGTDQGAGSAPPSSSAPAKATGRSVPVRLRIPAIGVDTPVIRLGLAADGTVEVPPITADDRAGWYGHSPVPGQVGPSVLLGHVTVGEYGDGVFRRLGELHRGDRIEARLGNGTRAEFAVSAVRTVAKADFPTNEVYGDVDRPELRLVTCGGPRSGTEYRDNVIVFAAPST